MKNKILSFPAGQKATKSGNKHQRNRNQKKENDVITRKEADRITNDVFSTEINKDVPLKDEFIRMYPENGKESYVARMFRLTNILNLVDCYLMIRSNDIESMIANNMKNEAGCSDSYYYSEEWEIYDKELAKYNDDVIQLIEYMTDRAMVDDALNTVIHLTGVDSFLFEEGEFIFREAFLDEEDEEYEAADEVSRANIELLTKFIWDTRAQRYITCATVKDVVPFQFALKRKIPKDDLEDEKDYLKAWVTRTVLNGGNIVLRKYDRKSDHYSICGFICSNGRVKGIMTDELRATICTDPDGNWVERENEDYFMAPLLFRDM